LVTELTESESPVDAAQGEPAEAAAGLLSPKNQVVAKMRRLPNSLFGLTTAITVVSALSLYVLEGYVYGYSDHTLLSVKGISWADDSAFVNDWFNERAPQPHWLFDLLTYLGESANQLPGLYFVYTLTGLAFFGFGTALLAHHWLPAERRALVLGVPLLAVLGPRFVLGTFLPFLSQALPNNLGGFMAYAAVAALITGRGRMACVLALATGLVHVQHGVVLGGILGLSALLAKGSLRSRLPLIGTAGALIVLSVVVSTSRGLTAGNDDMLEACTVGSIGHCNANTWAWVIIRDGLLMIAAASAVAAIRWRDWRTLLPAVIAPALVLTLGLSADRLDWGIFGELAQRLFVYRLGMNLALFVPWLAVLLAAGVGQRLPSALLRALGAALVSGYWVSAVFTRSAYATQSSDALRLGGFIVGLVLAMPMIIESTVRVVHRRTPLSFSVGPLISWAVAATLTTVTVAVISSKTQPGALDVGFRSDDGYVWIGQQLENEVPVGSVIAHPPDIEWVRLFSRRAVVGNCRAAPYGGDPWDEYKQRLAALGVDTTRIYECPRSGYEALGLDDIRALRSRFEATHAAFEAPDPKIAAAQAAQWKLTWYSGPGTAPWYVFEIP
jgi:hypothetical protein